MTEPESSTGIVRVGTFGAFYQRFDELLDTSTSLATYFIHSRRWRENHDATLKAFLKRGGTLEVFLPDLEHHELMFSLVRHFDDGPLIPSLVADAYRYFGRLARDFGQPTEIWLFNKYPTYSFYRFDRQAVIAMYSNVAAKKELPAFEVAMASSFGTFLAADIDDLKKECRRRAPNDLDDIIRAAPAGPTYWDQDLSDE
ncbi:MAG: hypothetical protein SFV24_26130 [Gemmatimonadales bacterium]|nr:hypothetical protein [Gemmatimonadales bacterium]